ncbi:MAG: adenylosuccinate lyase [Thermoprotei archaeon]|nr:MAG: adenylosuccinate lyase [Thermoprotei archaeon]RLF20320.1 MAG: adenylosuccinate lyase [Thermoprotei archaeon]
MSICPLEYRYGSQEMKEIFSRKNILSKMALVEKALLYGLERAGLVPRGISKDMERAIQEVDPRRIDELERKIGHDIMALTIELARLSGKAGAYIHLGATSYDIVDTTWALLIRDALSIVKRKLKHLIEILIEYSEKYKDTIMVGRTHGQHALPITLGFKFANYVYEFTRSYQRLKELEKRVVRGKIAGAVGTMAAWRDKGLIVEKETLSQLNLKPHLISTQIAPRDGFAELICTLAILGSQIDRLGIEIRELMRPEILEIAEGVEKRVGSSTMPHKLNPVTCERICALAKVLRGLVITALENIPLWHERDLTNSASERIIIPHAFLIIDEMLDCMNRVLRNLRVFPERMERNLHLTKGFNMLESVMVEMVKKGVPRHRAHEILRKVHRMALGSGKSAVEALLESEEIRKIFTEKELKGLLNPRNYLGSYGKLIRRTIEEARRIIEK